MRIASFLRLRCPVCERASLFRGYFDTPEVCPECGFYFLRETGYFLPHVPIGYVATVAVALSVWPILAFGLGVRSGAVILTSMLLAAIGFGVWFVRYAKMIWLIFDLAIHPASREDFESRGRESAQRRAPGPPTTPTTPSRGDDAEA